MSIGKLEFQLPEEQNDFERASKAGKLSSIVWDFDNEVLRKMTKYGNHPMEERELTEEESLLAHAIREKLWTIINEAGLGDLIV